MIPAVFQVPLKKGQRDSRNALCPSWLKGVFEPASAHLFLFLRRESRVVGGVDAGLVLL